MVLEDKTGIDGENFAVDVELDAVASSHITLTCQICDKLILEIANCNEGGRVVWYLRLQVNGTLEYAAILVNSVVGVRYNAYELTAIQINVVYV
jgi:hypothetical protein